MNITIDMDEWFALDQNLRTLRFLNKELSEALTQAQEENKALRVQMEILEAQEHRERDESVDDSVNTNYMNDDVCSRLEVLERRYNDDHPYDLRNRLSDLERAVERLSSVLGGRR